jgi:hydrogenase nickel incorporation protein HypA/HybF
MHELALCESVLDIIESEAKKQHFARVKTVWLEIGALSCVEPEAMQFCFDVVMKKTLVEGASLQINLMPGVAWCRHCQKAVPISQRFEPCPDCGHYQLSIVSGDEMRIKQLEVD